MMDSKLLLLLICMLFISSAATAEGGAPPATKDEPPSDSAADGPTCTIDDPMKLAHCLDNLGVGLDDCCESLTALADPEEVAACLCMALELTTSLNPNFYARRAYQLLMICGITSSPPHLSCTL